MGTRLVSEEDDTYVYYPNTCKDCPDRGSMMIWSTLQDQYIYLPGDRISVWESNYGEYQFRNIGWPERCKPCNARAQAYKRARASINRLEELRAAVENTFIAMDLDHFTRWKYLKFVTLTWSNELSDQPEPDMKKARKWLRRKRDKIIDKLDCLGGTDVMECVTKKVGDLFHHHVHMHGIWIMPYHDIEYVGEIMRRYVGRDQCRAIKPLRIENPDHPDGGYTMSAFSQARNYLIKYLTKQPNTRRSLWGWTRKGLDAERFYGDIARIVDKWDSA